MFIVLSFHTLQSIRIYLILSFVFLSFFILGSIYSLLFFFFNHTATTEFYTYLHTLSLHDALPLFNRILPLFQEICSARWMHMRPKIIQILDNSAGDIIPHHRRGHAYGLGDAIGIRAPMAFYHQAVQPQKHRSIVVVWVQMHLQHPKRRPRHQERSEEHTSELQSLMRISYAVFC